ncbi:MAG TPA: hypothetical protein PKH31_15860, partial [Candidatus Sumerlaeota bacterium]|nr:hypothetical protein [Candidatus Sumerlaeota bacterium]
MVRELQKTGVGVCVAALLGVWLCLRPGAAQEPRPRQLLAIDLLATGDRNRIVLQVDQMVPYTVTPVRKGQPLKIELVGCEAPSSLKPKPASNALVQGVQVQTAEGRTTLTFDLKTDDFETLDYTLQSEGRIIVDLKPRPGARTATPEPASGASKTPAPTPRVSLPTLPTPTPQRTRTPEPTPAVALPLALPRTKQPIPTPAPIPVRSPSPTPKATERPVARVETPQPSEVIPTPAAPKGIPTPVATRKPVRVALPAETSKKTSAPKGTGTEIEFFGLFPGYPTTNTLENLVFSRLDFPEDPGLKDELRNASLNEKVQDVYTLGARRGLLQHQPRTSLEALVYLMAECYFRETMARWNSSSRIPADFPAAVDHYEQAIRYAPDSPLRPLGDYRLSQLYGLQGGDDRLKSQILLQKLAANKSLPSIQSSILYDLGNNLSLQLHDEHPTITEHLDIA